MKNRFDLEEEINELSSFTKKLDILSNSIHDLTQDQVINIINGISLLLTLQQNKLFDTMQQAFKIDTYKE